MVPKRKYTKKEKKSEVSKEEVVEEEVSKEEIAEKIQIVPYKKQHAYIYYSGSDCDCYQFIKLFQVELDGYGLGSQVIIQNSNFINDIGIRNCFHNIEKPDKWTDICLSEEPVCAILIKKLPGRTPKNLFNVVKNNKEYEDEYIKVVEY